MLDGGVGMGARQDLERRIDRTRLLDHLARLERLGNGDEQPPRGREVGCRKDVGIRGVADDHLGAVAARLLQAVLAGLDHHHLAAAAGKLGADQGTDPPITTSTSWPDRVVGVSVSAGSAASGTPPSDVAGGPAARTARG
jgi:hypothetical protein